MLLLTAAGAAGGGAYVWQLYRETDRIVRDRFEQALHEKVPDWDVTFDDLHVDLSAGTARLSDVTLRLREHPDALVHVPLLIARLDRELLKQSQMLRIARVTLQEPTVWVNRDEAGDWNWRKFTPPPESDAPCPQIEIVNGTIAVHSARTTQLPETKFSCRSVDGVLVPSGHRRYVVRVMTDVDHAGALAIDGSIDLTKRTWQLTGDVAALDTQQGVIDVAAGLSPELRHQMTALSEQGTVGDWVASPGGAPPARPATSPRGRVPVRTASTAPPSSEFTLPELGVEAQIGVHFELGQPANGAPLQYVVAATIHRGRIVNPALPVPLYDLSGRIRASHQEVVIEDVSAANGDSRLRVSGRLDRTDTGWRKDLTVQAANLVLDRSVREYLHNDAVRRCYDQIQPAGKFNLDVRVIHDGVSPWDIRLNEFTALDCSCLHEAFQYPIHGITGAIRQGVGQEFRIELDGMAGERPIQLRGWARNPGPQLEARFDITATDVPLDERVLHALALPKYDKVRRALELLRLEGLASFQAILFRPAGAPKFSLKLDVAVHDGALDYTMFPYRLTGFSGNASYDSAERVWRFNDLRGRHIGAEPSAPPVLLEGDGSFDQRQPPGLLELAVFAHNAPIDKDLHRACTVAKDDLGRIWDELTPAGTLDVAVDLHWRPGPDGRLDIRLPHVTLSNGRIKLRALPIEWTDVEGSFAWEQGKASFQSPVKGRHNETQLVIDGANPGDAYVELRPQPNVEWRVHLQKLYLRGLVCDDELRRALPPGMAGIVKALDPQGPLDTDISIDLKGGAPSTNTVTAHWSQTILLNGNRLTAGVVVEDAVGEIKIVDGIWDGAFATVDGSVNLESARALNMPFAEVNGPFTVDGNVLTIGTPAWNIPNWRYVGPVVQSNHNRFRGRELRVERFYADQQHKGRLGLRGCGGDRPGRSRADGARAAITMGDASLRAWARDRRITGQRLQGSVNGRVEFIGHGTSGRSIQGNGFVKISQAELFELPVFAQMLPMLNFKRSGKMLFNEGFGDFQLHDGQVDFQVIDLTGDAFQLIGRGWVEYAADSAGKLNLNFISKADGQFLGGLGSVPVLKPMLFDNLLQVRVTGTINQPQVAQLPGSPAESFRGLINDVDKLRRQMMTPFGFPQQGQAPAGMRPR
ncbi:MAG: hypothetical protein U0992_18790 [Planctomycetaceae bacterium]